MTDPERIEKALALADEVAAEQMSPWWQIATLAAALREAQHRVALPALNQDYLLKLRARARAIQDEPDLFHLHAFASDVEDLLDELLAWLDSECDKFGLHISRMDAETRAYYMARSHPHAVRAALREAEERADAWMTPFDGYGIEWHENLPSPYLYQAADFSKLVAAVHEYEAALREARAENARLREELAEAFANGHAHGVKDALSVSPPADEARKEVPGLIFGGAMGYPEGRHRKDFAPPADEAKPRRGENLDDPTRCANCGHSKALHFKHDAYVPGKCDFQYDLCGCTNYEPADEAKP